MNLGILILLLILIIILFLIVIRLLIYLNLSNLNKIGKHKTEENLLYDNYFQTSNQKKTNKLKCQLGIFRKYIWSHPLEYELQALKLKHKTAYKILIVSNYDSNLELERHIVKNYPQIEIISTTTNLLNAKFLNETIEKEQLKGITVAYSQPEDLFQLLGDSNYLFDRILVRECLGNIKNTEKFWSGLSKLLASGGMISVRTFTMEPIFEHDTELTFLQNRRAATQFEIQKKLIDYWNYNFSTTTSVINQIKPFFKEVKYSEIKFWKLIFLYNFTDFTRAMHIYFKDMGLKLQNLDDWRGVSSLNILFLEII